MIAGYTRCTYRQAQVPLGRARTRCPSCGAELQSDRLADPHYIRPPRPVVGKSDSRHVSEPEDLDLPSMLGEPEPLI